MLRTVHLHGRLGKKFGKRFELDVNSATEAARALAFQLPGFAEYLRHRQYCVSVGQGTVLDSESINMQLGQQRDIHITPAGAMAGIETILLAGVLLFSAVAAISVMSMPKAPAASGREEATKTASFIFDGAQNVTEQGHVVPLIYGRWRVGSVVASSGITTTDVNQAGVSANPSNPYGGGGGYGGYIGTTPGILGSPHGNQWTILLKGGKGGGGGSARAAQEDPNTLQSQATAKVLDVIGEGEIVGLVDGLKSVYFDETPLQNEDDSFNFAGVAVEQRVGLPDQDFIPGFTQAENTRVINTEVTQLLGAVTRSINDATVTVARVTIRLPQLYQQDTTNGDLKSSTVAVKISVQSDGGGFTDVETMTFTGKTNSGYQRSLDIRLPNGALRDIRVTRLTADAAVASLSNETFWDLLTEVVEAKLSYPDTAAIGLTVDARQFGSNIPTRSYDVKGLIIEVPTNYDPDTGLFAGIWDGTFKREWTDDPAWVLRDITLSKRYGLGNRIAENVPDKWALYAISQYNNELVPDGFGGMQRRYTINCCINNPAQAYEVLASISSNFRGMTYWGSGSIVAVQDRPEDPSILITPSNVENGDISYGRITPVERRRSVALVYWNDPEDGYRLTPEFYEDPELVRRFGRRGDSADMAVTAFGVSRRGQAHRMARWILEDESPGSNSTASYNAGDDHGFVEPYRIASLADPMFTVSRRGGRVKAATLNQIETDSPVTITAGQVYTLRVMLPDGTSRARTVTNVPGVATILTVSGAAYSAAPNPGAVWALESDTIANRQWRIRQMTTDDPPYAVKAVLHDPTKYDRVELDRDIDTPNFLGLPSGPLLPPTEIVAFEFLLQDGNAAIPCVQVSWDASTDPRVTFYQAQYKSPTGNWEAFADGIDVSRFVRGIEVGEWSFRVRALDSLGRKTSWIEAQIALDGQIDDIPAVTGLSILADPVALTTMIIWVNPVDYRPLRYEVLFDDAGVFANAISLAILDTQEYIISQPGTYWVRTRFLDAFSVLVPSILVTPADLPAANLQATFVQATTPSEAESYVGNSWLNSITGYFYDRIDSTGLMLAGDSIQLGGVEPFLAWTESAYQPLVSAYDEAGAALAAAELAELIGLEAQTTADGKINTFVSETEPIASANGDLWFKVSSGELRRWSSLALAWSAPLVDLTQISQVTAAMSPDKNIPADHLGAVTAENIALIIWGPTVIKGGTSIKLDDLTHYVISEIYGGTFNVSNVDGAADKGNVSLATITGNEAGGSLTPSYNGIALPKLPFKVTKNIATAPTAPSGTDCESWVSGEFNVLSTNNYVAITSVKTLALASGQTLYGSAPIGYIVAGNGGAVRTMTAKWQYAVAGSGSWNDFATGISGSQAQSAINRGFPEPEYEEPWPGYVAVTQSKSGLAAGNYDVRIVASLDVGLRTVTPYGSALMEAKV